MEDCCRAGHKHMAWVLRVRTLLLDALRENGSLSCPAVWRGICLWEATVCLVDYGSHSPQVTAQNQRPHCLHPHTSVAALARALAMLIRP